MLNDGFDATASLTRLILETFRLNGALIAAGDALVKDLGLTSARWQVLGAASLALEPLSVAGLARSMGLTRQAVQRVADDLEREGLVSFQPNPEHQRAKLVLLTPQGEEIYRRASERQALWATRLARGLATDQIEVAEAILRTLRDRLQADPSNR